MHPNLTIFTNRGSVEIVFVAEEPVDFVVLHSKELNITQVTISHGDEPVEVKRILENTHLELLYIEVSKKLLTNVEYLLKINFTKILEEKLDGFYISSYVESTTERQKYLATTHFEPTSARSAFPCFDEPAFKAVFTLKMVHEHGYDVYFNSEKQDTIPYNKDGLQLSIFEKTVKMSTYLVAFVVCDFKPLHSRTKDGKLVRVLVPKDLVNNGELALKSAVNILTYFEEFFNITYPLKKLDLIAVPDFAAGAMENWGLLTFRTSMLIHNERITNNVDKEQIVIVISHEIAHQWFGNLVTMKWWNDLWLNEGFSSYVENLGVDYLYPDWRMVDQFVQTTHNAMERDSLRSSHAILAKVKDDRDIDPLFDPISYKKGAALIRMLQNFLKPENLRLGLKEYLQRYQFSNAETADLWRCFSKVNFYHSMITQRI